MKALQCTQCNQVVEMTTDFRTCTQCSSNAWMVIVVSLYWFDLAVSFGYERKLACAVLVKDFFDIWNKDEYATFDAFMRSEVLI